MNPLYDFKGQVALVTGASAGIGFATAKVFAETGAKVVLADVDGKALLSANEKLASEGYDVISIRCDVSSEVQVSKLIEQIVLSFGKLDMAFNNAGIAGPSGPFLSETIEGFDKVNDVNLKGIWICMQQELKQMQKQGNGVIVNCSSLGGLVGRQVAQYIMVQNTAY